MEEGELFGKRMQDTALSIAMFLNDEGFTIPEGCAVLAMALAAAGHEFGMSERELMGKMGMTVRKVYANLDKQKARKNHVKTYS